METEDDYKPWSEVAEQSVIGGLLLDSYKLPDCREILKPEYFLKFE